jgi:tRNA threonylcarbamoyl adenosine modification protein YeaZ
MNLLISTEQNDHFSVAIGERELLKLKTVKKPYKQSELLLKTIKEFLEKNRLEMSALQNIFVVNGPGGFSATRIGVATANALGYALEIPVVGIEIKKEWTALIEKEKLMRVWLEAVALTEREDFKGQIVLPVYDKEPNITMKK